MCLCIYIQMKLNKVYEMYVHESFILCQLSF